jgi:hypothetical protein
MSAAIDMSLDGDGFRPIGLGHNSAKNLREMLLEQYAAILRRAEELLAAVDRVPSIENDDTLGKVSELIKQISASIKVLDVSRVAEKEPFLSAGRDVDGVFNGVKEKLEKAKTFVNKKVTAFLEAKAQAEREARQAEERRQAEEARRAEEERRKAEQARREAEERARQAEEAARRQKEQAEREAREREERHRRELAEANARAEAEESKRRQSDANREKAQAEADRMRREAAERAERERVEAEARAKRDAEDAERRAQEAREDAQRRADQEALEAQRAEEAEARRIAAEKLAMAKPAELSRTRSELGALSSLRAKWVFKVEDRDAINLNQLKAYFSAEAFDKAVNAAIRNGVRPDSEGNQPLAGIKIFQINEAATR